jgi:hypothetical protein
MYEELCSLGGKGPFGSGLDLYRRALLSFASQLLVLAHSSLRSRAIATLKLRSCLLFSVRSAHCAYSLRSYLLVHYSLRSLFTITPLTMFAAHNRYALICSSLRSY